MPILRLRFLIAFAVTSVFAFALTLAPAAQAAESSLDVVVTIRPIHSLVSAILSGVATPKLLLQGASSPHDYALKPSDAEALSHARVIVRVSENLETFLNKPLQALGGKARIVTLEQVPGLSLLPVRSWAAAGEDHDEDEEENAHHHHDHATDGADVHFWLDPLNALVLTDELVRQFSDIDPAHAPIFAANAQELKKKLVALDEELRAKFAPVKDRPFVVFHDVLHYLEKRYGLKTAGAVTVSPERQPGAKHLSELRSKIRSLGAVCVFAEPQFPPKIVRTLTEGTNARFGTVDEIGVDSPPGPNQYADFMRRNADHIAGCLTAS